jgi:hypothetical protein
MPRCRSNAFDKTDAEVCVEHIREAILDNDLNRLAPWCDNFDSLLKRDFCPVDLFILAVEQGHYHFLTYLAPIGSPEVYINPTLIGTILATEDFEEAFHEYMYAFVYSPLASAKLRQRLTKQPKQEEDFAAKTEVIIAAFRNHPKATDTTTSLLIV